MKDSIKFTGEDSFNEMVKEWGEDFKKFAHFTPPDKKALTFKGGRMSYIAEGVMTYHGCHGNTLVFVGVNVYRDSEGNFSVEGDYDDIGYG